MTKTPVCIVTGAAAGLGKAIADALRARGETVIGLDRQPATGTDDRTIDLTDPAQLRQFGRVAPPWRALYHVAGIGPDAPPEAILAVNLAAPIQLTRLLNSATTPGASVTSIASLAATLSAEAPEVLAEATTLELNDLGPFVSRHDLNGPTAYRLSKAGLVAWTRMRAVDSPSMRFNTVSPGPVQTPLWERSRHASPDKSAQFLSLVPHVPKPEAIAPAIAALGLPEFHWLNGADIPMDGGLRARLQASDGA